MSLQTVVRIDGKKLHLPDGRKDFRKEIESLPEGHYVLSFKRVEDVRSVAQNRAWHALRVKPLADYFGWEEGAMHEYLKQEFLGVREFLCDPKTGEIIGEATIPESTATLSKKRMSELFDSVARWASQKFGIILPDPDQQDFL